MTPYEQIEVAAVLAEVLGKAKTLSGRIRLQKLTYLLQQQGLPELANVEFVYHHYGPYSDDVAEVLSKGVRSGFFEEKTESFDDEWQRYEYSLRRDADHYVTVLSEQSKRLIDSAVGLTADVHWRILELAATVLFLRRRDGRSIGSAVLQALSLKPGCRNYENDAIALLEKLELTN